MNINEIPLKTVTSQSRNRYYIVCDTKLNFILTNSLGCVHRFSIFNFVVSIREARWHENCAGLLRYPSHQHPNHLTEITIRGTCLNNPGSFPADVIHMMNFKENANFGMKKCRIFKWFVCFVCHWWTKRWEHSKQNKHQPWREIWSVNAAMYNKLINQTAKQSTQTTQQSTHLVNCCPNKQLTLQ